MKIPSLAAGAMVGALSVMSLTLPDTASAALRAESLGAADQTATTHFNVYLPLSNQSALEKLLEDQVDSNSSNYHHWLTPGEFKEQFGPSRATIAKATAVLKAAGFTVTAERTQSLRVEGSVAAVEKTFGAHLQRVRTQKGNIKFAAAEGRLTMPAALESLGAVVPEFGARVSAHVHSKAVPRLPSGPTPLVRLSSQGGFFPNDLNEAYQLPSFQTKAVPLGSRQKAQIVGLGAHIGIVISSVIDPDDLAAQFNSTTTLTSGSLIQAYSKNTTLPVPTVTVRAVEGGSGPFNPATDDALEASLDTQMSLGTAPGATETLYNIPDLDDDSIMAAYTDVDEDNLVDVVSSSFGECELFYTKPFNGGTDFTFILKAEHALFQQGNAEGITFLASSGDSGSQECVSANYLVNDAPNSSFTTGVSTPADDPNVTAVGGTNLITVAKPKPDDATYKTENADFDALLPEDFAYPNNPVSGGVWGSGGGFSLIWSKPKYQNVVNTGSKTERSLPDLSLMMGGCPFGTVNDCTVLPRSFALIFIGGQLSGVIGTSSSSPEFAGVLALAIELNGGRLGNVNSRIYDLAATQTLFGGAKAPAPLQFFHREIEGSNGVYTVKPGQAYSEVLGNSTLDVQNFLALPFAVPTGTPNTPSNP